jgi:probable HAF family extracellular repeat protein
MLHWKSFGLAMFAALCLLAETAGSAHAQCALSLSQSTGCATEWSGGSAIKLGSLPGFPQSGANSINDAGQAVGYSQPYGGGGQRATEWSSGGVIDLGGAHNAVSVANGINNSGQVVGYSNFFAFVQHATEWSGGSVIDLGGVPGFTGSLANAINDKGQVVGYSDVGDVVYATEWSSGSVINLEGLPGSTFSEAYSINDAGQAVGLSFVDGASYATEWSGGNAIALGGAGTAATGINDSGQVAVTGPSGAIVWSDGSIINVGPMQALGINNSGQVVGNGAFGVAVEWTAGGGIISLGNLPGSILRSEASAIDDLGVAVGTTAFPPMSTPEPSTWAMMLAGFAGLGLAGYRRAKAS